MSTTTAIKSSHAPGSTEEFQAGREIEPASYAGEIGVSGDLTAEATWEWDKELGREVLVLWRN